MFVGHGRWRGRGLRCLQHMSFAVFSPRGFGWWVTAGDTFWQIYVFVAVRCGGSPVPPSDSEMSRHCWVEAHATIHANQLAQSNVLGDHRFDMLVASLMRDRGRRAVT